MYFAPTLCASIFKHFIFYFINLIGFKLVFDCHFFNGFYNYCFKYLQDLFRFWKKIWMHQIYLSFWFPCFYNYYCQDVGKIIPTSQIISPVIYMAKNFRNSKFSTKYIKFFYYILNLYNFKLEPKLCFSLWKCWLWFLDAPFKLAKPLYYYTNAQWQSGQKGIKWCTAAFVSKHSCTVLRCIQVLRFT